MPPVFSELLGNTGIGTPFNGVVRDVKAVPNATVGSGVATELLLSVGDGPVTVGIGGQKAPSGPQLMGGLDSCLPPALLGDAISLDLYQTSKPEGQTAKKRKKRTEKRTNRGAYTELTAEHARVSGNPDSAAAPYARLAHPLSMQDSAPNISAGLRSLTRSHTHHLQIPRVRLECYLLTVVHAQYQHALQQSWCWWCGEDTCCEPKTRDLRRDRCGWTLVWNFRFRPPALSKSGDVDQAHYCAREGCGI